ncbi:PREDICTED: inactive polyglycylase TTLL10 [Condylura cristata]|uniref:inactive polyglycylase TTLL10 n=1 Tax=Condylura cristata TaxID=143302 RepID=UPI000642A455|nr:PREDICTED: inactive polyglycylase TTLL10 [Condylura cristata]
MGSSSQEGLPGQLSLAGRERSPGLEGGAPPRALPFTDSWPQGPIQAPPTTSNPAPPIHRCPALPRPPPRAVTPRPHRISSYCKSKGWQRIQDGRREDYMLKWCEVKSRDSYCSFREGEQLLYQLPNNSLLTTKIGLLSVLRESSRATTKAPRTELGPQPKHEEGAAPALEELEWTGSPGHPGPQRVLKMEEFFPETYRLDIRDEREAFFTLFDETQMWICKPTASNQGKGIFLLRNQEDAAALQTRTQSSEDDPVYRKMWFRVPQARVVQRCRARTIGLRSGGAALGPAEVPQYPSDTLGGDRGVGGQVSSGCPGPSV